MILIFACWDAAYCQMFIHEIGYGKMNCSSFVKWLCYSSGRILAQNFFGISSISSKKIRRPNYISLQNNTKLMNLYKGAKFVLHNHVLISESISKKYKIWQFLRGWRSSFTFRWVRGIMNTIVNTLSEWVR